MDPAVIQIAFILLLIVANGVFAMSEIAVVSAKRLRLEQRADEGDTGTHAALELMKSPSRFFSTVQQRARRKRCVSSPPAASRACPRNRRRIDKVLGKPTALDAPAVD
jgi:hypothetical protein